jgi:hypothetical protein
VRVATPRWIAAVALVTTAATAVSAAPASASTPGPHYDVGSSFNAYTDSATPDETTYYPDGGLAPVGTSVDEAGVTHTTRAYAGFDISGVNAVRLQQAVILLPDDAYDCSGTRDLTVREIAAFEGNTWAAPPATKGAAVQVSAEVCGPTPPTADVTTMVARALARGDRTLWVEIRVPQRHETIPKYRRMLHFNEVRFQATLINRAPNKPTKLGVSRDDQPCTDDFATNTDFSVFADMTDADRSPSDPLTPEFEWWPVSDPTAVTLMTTGIASGGSGLYGVGSVPARTMADGRYGWHARVFDQRAYSPWSDSCYFTVDRTSPGTSPTVASPEYPENTPSPVGGRFKSGTFLFTANGSADVVRFAYGQDGFIDDYVEADQTGGAATVTWYPDASGIHTLTVWSLDAAGNRSEPRQYVLNVG